jgi:hypothetical protein
MDGDGRRDVMKIEEAYDEKRGDMPSSLPRTRLMAPEQPPQLMLTLNL